MEKDLSEQRKQDFIQAVDFGRPDKIPVDIKITGRPFAYAGTAFDEVKDEPQKAAAAYTSFPDDIPVDCFILDSGCIKRHGIYGAMGSSEYIPADDGVTVQHNQAGADFLDESEYPERIGDFNAFYRKKKMEKVPAFDREKDMLCEAMKLAAKRTSVHNGFREPVDRLCDLPKGGLLIMTDQDDPFEAHKIVEGHQALAAA